MFEVIKETQLHSRVQRHRNIRKRYQNRDFEKLEICYFLTNSQTSKISRVGKNFSD